MSYLISNPLFSQSLNDFTSASTQDRDPLRDYTAEFRNTADLFLDLTSINSFSVIFEKFDVDDNPIPWNHEKYEIWVSNSAWDNPPDDYYSYENQVPKILTTVG